ncbi:prepilin peptidase [Streptomyces albidoflavus]
MTGPLWLAPLAALWGAGWGALLPRAAYRFAAPAGEEWHTACPQGHPLGGWLGGPNCPDCRTPLGRRALPVLLAAALCAGLALTTGPRPELAVWLLAAPVGLLLAVVDLRVMRLPDPLTLPLAAGVLALLGVAAALPGAAGSWLGALYGLLALGGGAFVLFLINPDGFAFGDVKLCLALGAALGWYGLGAVFLGALAGLLVGAVHGLFLVLAKGAGRRTAFAFGPSLLAGAYGVLLVAGAAAA